MKRIVILSILIVGIMGDALGATRSTGRTNSRGGTSTATTSVQKNTSARAATNSRIAPRATKSTSTSQNTVNRGRAATTTPTVMARAGATQKIIGTGTKVATAAKNIVVSEECQQKYEGCMDSFCMLDNDTGGRCLCSDKNAELDAILAEIEKLDQRSYKMATFGVEQIEMGEDANAVIAQANSIAQSMLTEEEQNKQNSKKPLDLSLWDTAISFETEDIFGTAQSPIDGQEGDDLHRAATELCIAQIPECAADIQMLQLMYAQRIKSDCTAYENSLKQQKNASAQKLAAAEQALQDAAYEQLQLANKYDKGQCTLEFTKCMQTTAGCGEDFSNCASMVAMDSTNIRQSTSNKAKNYQIKGDVTTIEISASTYDALVAKKSLCDSITQSCVKVADLIWDEFLRQVAPQIKNAELIAEDNARQNCISNISSCFQKACKDTMDPNDPDGSYDLCLTRPETMLNLCKVPLNACGIDTTNPASAKKSYIWEGITARLTAMRTDACTTAVKDCLQSEERCGKDYSQCLGLDLEALKEMCPLEKLVACQTKDGNDNYVANWTNIENIVQGIWLGIDNAALETCQNIVNEKMLELCGDTSSCMAFDDDNSIGTESLLSYQDNNGDYVIEGLISFGNVKIEKAVSTDTDVKFGKYEINISDYKDHLNTNDPTSARVVSALQSTANKINQKISILSQDPRIQMCIEGRDMTQISKTNRDTNSGRSTARFPHLLDSSILAIISSGLDRANKNYTEKYNELLGKALEAKDDAVKSVLCAAMASSTNPTCTAYATDSAGNAICTEYRANTFEDIFDNESQTGLSSGEDLYSTKYVISGAKISDIAAAQQNGHNEYTQTDSMGNMLGRIAMSAVYSSNNNTCTVTTTTTLCSEFEAIITRDTKTTCKNGGLSIVGGIGCKGGGGVFTIGKSKKTTTINETYEGLACQSFMDPSTTTASIKM